MKRIFKNTTIGTVLATLGALLIMATVPEVATPLPAMAETGLVNCMAAPPGPAQGRPVIEVLTGVTPTDRSTTLADIRAAAMSKIAAAGFNMQARLIMDTVGDGVSESDLAVNTQLQPSGPNQLFQQQNLQCKERGIATALRRLQDSRVRGGVDLLSALHVAQSNLVGLIGMRTPVDVVVMSNMLNASSPLQLTEPNVLAADANSLIAQVRSAGLLPQCRGWNVYIIGGGVTATGGLDATQYEQLQNFWTNFFAACGGQVVAYAAQLAQFPIKLTKPNPVRIETKSTIDAATHQRQVVMTLPNDVLFGSGSADLSVFAGAVLTQLLPVLLQQYPNGSIQVTGYTDNVPIDIPGGNVQLSIERAQAVIAWLSQHGVSDSRMHALGLGSADPVASNATPTGQAADRRVVVTISK